MFMRLLEEVLILMKVLSRIKILFKGISCYFISRLCGERLGILFKDFRDGGLLFSSHLRKTVCMILNSFFLTQTKNLESPGQLRTLSQMITANVWLSLSFRSPNTENWQNFKKSMWEKNVSDKTSTSNYTKKEKEMF